MIEINNITVQFSKNKKVIDNFSYVFKDNKIVTIMGESGKGKTTLLRCLAGIHKVDNGKIFYNKKQITKPNKDIFMMHQHYTNFQWKTCLENIMFPLTIHGRITKEQINEGKNIMNLVGLGDCEYKYPSELSGGMNQRLALARVLMAKPKVILMDEPMSALDYNTRTKMQDLILDLHKNTKNLIIMVTHDENESKRMGDETIIF